MKNSNKFFEELYLKEYDNILGYIRRHIIDTNAVEDIVQDTFMEAYRKRDVLMTHPNLPGWLHLAAKNKMMKWHEKQKKYSLDNEFLTEIADPDTDTRIDEYKMIELYASVVDTLSEQDLEILRSYYEYGFTSQELAKKLGITEACFKVRVLRMKQKIRDSIKMMLFFIATLMIFTGDRL